MISKNYILTYYQQIKDRYNGIIADLGLDFDIYSEDIRKGND